MRATRRRLLGAGGALAVAGLAGCLDRVTGGAIEFEAAPASVAESALDETGYGEHRRRSETETRTFEAAGERQDVEVTSHVAEYDRAVELLGERFRGAVFTVLSTPQVEVLGQTFNPVGDMDAGDLADMLQERYETVENVRQRDEYTTTVLGTGTVVGRFDADARVAGSGLTVDLRLHIAEPVEIGEDFVLAVGAYPRLVDDGDAVLTLLDGVRHEG